MRLFHGDCLDVMKNFDDNSVDMVLCDLPYGTTSCSWDVVIPFDELWKQYKRIAKDNTPFVLFASQPFTSSLIMSNVKSFKYCWVWDKINKFSGHLNCKKQPLRITEDVCVFYNNQPIYNPQFTQSYAYKVTSVGRKTELYGEQKNVVSESSGERYPKNLISIKGNNRGTEGRIHPSQKPVELLEYLIKTYTNENQIVLDNCMGSGSTGIACLNTNRQFIGIEKDDNYFNIAKTRLETHEQKIMSSKSLTKFMRVV